jgi:hypothetical protein
VEKGGRGVHAFKQCTKVAVKALTKLQVEAVAEMLDQPIIVSDELVQVFGRWGRLAMT